MEIRWILSDLDGVIRKFPYERDDEIENKYGLSKGAIYKTAFEKTLLVRAVTGLITDEIWRSEVAKELTKEYGEEKAQLAVQEWGDFPGLLDEEYLNFLLLRFPGIPIAVLTNGSSRLQSDLAKLGVQNRFSKIFNSYEIGVGKPDKRVYEHVLEVLGCSPSEILFIDDSISHIEAAKGLGMNAHYYTDLKTLREWLSKKDPL